MILKFRVVASSVPPLAARHLDGEAERRQCPTLGQQGEARRNSSHIARQRRQWMQGTGPENLSSNDSSIVTSPGA
jgi:hypothetical protein